MWPFKGPSNSGGSQQPLQPPASPPPPSSADAETKQKIQRGNFDPDALERGARALKDIDSSPNSSRAFTLLMDQEGTRRERERTTQLQIQLQMEQQHERNQQVHEESQKRLAEHKRYQHQEEQRTKAEMQRQLDERRFALQKKHEEEKRQREHEQFLRQEQIRKETEEKIQKMRRRTLEDEAHVQEHNIKIKAKAEGEARVQETRALKDIKREEMIEQAKLQRTAAQEMWDRRSTSYTKWMEMFRDTVTDREKMATLVGGTCLVLFGGYAAKHSTAAIAQYTLSVLGKPSLVRETSRHNWGQPLQAVRDSFTKSKKAKRIMDGIVLSDDLHRKLTWFVRATKNTRKHNAPYRHVLLHGPPGTGKTLFAKRLAYQSGMDYAILTGGDFSPLGSSAVTELHKVFDWAEKSKKGTILFIDEADAFLKKGREGDRISEEMRNALSAFLYRTGTESSKFLVCLASNVPQSIDSAVMDRVDESVEFRLPGHDERKRLFQMYFDKYIKKAHLGGSDAIQTVGWDESSEDDLFDQLSAKTEGFSGRRIQKLCIAIQSAVYGGLEASVSPELCERILSETLESFNHAKRSAGHLDNPEALS